MSASITCGCLRFSYSFYIMNEKLEAMVEILKDEHFILTKNFLETSCSLWNNKYPILKKRSGNLVIMTKH